MALIVALLRGEARKVERLGWAIDAVKADKIPLAVVSITKVLEIFIIRIDRRTLINHCI